MIQLLLPCWFWYAVIGIIFAVATLQQADEAGLDISEWVARSIFAVLVGCFWPFAAGILLYNLTV
jgi:hypothetical protein